LTDQQYAILDQGMRHLPGGVDEYLKLRRAQQKREPGPSSATGSGGSGGAAGGASGSAADDDGRAPAGSALAGADRRAAQKELSAIERRFDTLGQAIASVHERLAAHDQADYSGLQRVTAELHAFEAADHPRPCWLTRSRAPALTRPLSRA